MGNDPFLQQAKEILNMTGSENTRVVGSYRRWGREKACDLDLQEQWP